MCPYGSVVPLRPLLPGVSGSAALSGVLFAVYALTMLAAPLAGSDVASSPR